MGISSMLGKEKSYDPKGILTPVTSETNKTISTSGFGAAIGQGMKDYTGSQNALKEPLDDTAPAGAPEIGDEIVSEGSNDTRVRIRAGNYSAAIASVLGPKDPTKNILSILYDTGGLLFPYTPTINVSQSVNWDPLSLVHTNWDVNTYQRTPSVNLSVSGVFTTQNQREGEYLMAVLHFLRTVTKSYYGNGEAAGYAVDGSEEEQTKAKLAATSKAGIPPPVLYFDGYGDFMFRNVPIVIKSHSYAFDENTDSKLFVSRSGHGARLPAKLILTIELGMQMNPNKARTEFDLDLFRTGELLNRGGWF